MKHKTLLKNLVSILVPMLCSVLLMGALSVELIYRYNNNEMQRINTNLLNSARFNIELIMRDLDLFSYNFSSNPSIITKTKDVLSSPVFNYTQQLSFQFISNAIDIPVDTSPYLHSVYIYYYGYDTLLCSDFGIMPLADFYDKEWVGNLSMPTGRRTWLEKRAIRRYAFEKEATRVVSANRTLLSPGTSKADGLLTINLRVNVISSMLQGLLRYDNQMLLVLDSENVVVFCNSDALLFTQAQLSSLLSLGEDGRLFEVSDHQYHQYRVVSSKYGLTYISLVPTSVGDQLAGQQVLVTVWVALLAVLIGTVVAWKTTQRGRAQLFKIVHILSEYEQTGAYPQGEKKPSNVYDMIIYNILGMFMRSANMKMQLAERKHQMDLYELKALQTQINPHFLYNTLDTINWKAMEMSGGYGILNEMIENLGHILKYCLSNAEEKVSLASEVAYTECYVSIQNIRYNNRIQMLWEYRKEDSGLPVIKLLFQPLIENSMKHGDPSRLRSVAIKIRIQRKDDRLHIAVIDNGVGMSKDRLQEVRESLSQKWQDNSHIGLVNTNQRLRLLYGEQYSIKICSHRGLGTVIHFSIPCTAPVSPQKNRDPAEEDGAGSS